MSSPFSNLWSNHKVAALLYKTQSHSIGMNSTRQKDLGWGPWSRRAGNKEKASRNQTTKGLIGYRKRDLNFVLWAIMGHSGPRGKRKILGLLGWRTPRIQGARILRSLPLPPVPKKVMQKDFFRLNHSVNYQPRLWPQTSGKTWGEMGQTSESWEDPFGFGSRSPHRKQLSSLFGFFLETHS